MKNRKKLISGCLLGIVGIACLRYIVKNEKIRSIRLRDIGMNKKKSNRIHLGMIHKQIVMLRKKM